MWELFEKGLATNSLVTAFAFVGIIMWVSVILSKHLTFGRIHGSAIAIVIGLVLAWVGGTMTGGQKGLADLTLFSGIGLMGGAMLRDFAIVATAFEVQATEAKKAGLIGVIALLLGTVLPFIVGACMAWAFGYRDAVSMTTIGAGAVTYIVGPVTGAAIGASSETVLSPNGRSESVSLPSCVASQRSCACSGVTARVTLLTLLSLVAAPRVVES